MKGNYLIIFSILSILFISGCVNGEISPENNEIPTETTQDVHTGPPQVNTDSIFFERDGVTFEHNWPDTESKSLKGDESEIFVYNENDNNIEFIATNMIFFVGETSYNIYSGTWEKFPSRNSWDRIEQINIGQGYSGEPLILEPGQKGKIHYHYEFDISAEDPNQRVQIDLTYTLNGETKIIDQELIR